MSVFIPIFFISAFLVVVFQAVLEMRHDLKLIIFSRRVASEKVDQRVLLNKLMEQMKRMEIYREAEPIVDTSKTKELFHRLIVEEDHNLDVLNKALVHR